MPTSPTRSYNVPAYLTRAEWAALGFNVEEPPTVYALKGGSMWIVIAHGRRDLVPTHKIDRKKRRGRAYKVLIPQKNGSATYSTEIAAKRAADTWMKS